MKMLMLSFLLVWNSTVFSQETAFFDAANTVFVTYVSDGKVDYAEIKKNPETLNKALSLAAESRVTPQNTEVYKAFWINAYNLAVIKGIVETYPINSPLDKKGFFDEITYDLGGQKITLNAIENEFLRATFPQEARFHFALVCAGLSCPPLIDQAYYPDTLKNRLQKQTIAALNDPNFIKVKGKKVAVSMIFKWYAADFERQGGVLSFINNFKTKKLPEDAVMSFYDYDWALNEQK
ncbi:DUF547 domain-containing protein [Flavimarina sp. Hel_I_48]|uniref:DUF547 domain-containing protein n=1 Tax=Flavimarina sp. Hel_I_48 TaxID=1392488 RepID=UPI0004DFC4FF|nr:DUF547 domain-containing protein [Flavimarina sp. Hel_I_48]